MSLIGNVGRWHGASAPHAEDAQAATPDDVRHLRNEMTRHRTQLTEWLHKRRECALAITNHYAAMRKLRTRAARLGVTL